MYIKRQAENDLRSALSGGKVTLLLGARQVGKTTLVEELLRGEDSLFLNFDIEIDKTRFLAAASLPPDEGLRTLGSPRVLVLDEAQRLPEVSRIVKGWYDARVATRILMLGSSSLDLLDQSAESLTGRNRKLILPPLLFAEALQSQTWSPEPKVRPSSRRRCGRSFSSDSPSAATPRLCSPKIRDSSCANSALTTSGKTSCRPAS